MTVIAVKIVSKDKTNNDDKHYVDIGISIET